MIETKYKVKEYKGEELKDFEIKFTENATVFVYYKGEMIPHILELVVTPQKVVIKFMNEE